MAVKYPTNVETIEIGDHIVFDGEAHRVADIKVENDEIGLRLLWIDTDFWQWFTNGEEVIYFFDDDSELEIANIDAELDRWDDPFTLENEIFDDLND